MKNQTSRQQFTLLIASLCIIGFAVTACTKKASTSASQSNNCEKECVQSAASDLESKAEEHLDCIGDCSENDDSSNQLMCIYGCTDPTLTFMVDVTECAGDCGCLSKANDCVLPCTEQNDECVEDCDQDDYDCQEDCFDEASECTEPCYQDYIDCAGWDSPLMQIDDCLFENDCSWDCDDFLDTWDDEEIDIDGYTECMEDCYGDALSCIDDI